MPHSTQPCVRRPVTTMALHALFVLLLCMHTARSAPLPGLGRIDSTGGLRIEAETMETWNGCLEARLNMCDTICDPYETKHKHGNSCLIPNNGSCSGKMAIGLCGTFSFIDFMPVPPASSFRIRYSDVPEGFSFSIFVNGEPWREKIPFPPSNYTLATDSGEVKIREWRDTLFHDVPLNREQNFLRIQREGTGIPDIDYVTVYMEGVGTRRTTGGKRCAVPAVRISGNTITCRSVKGHQTTLDLIDASGRVVETLVDRSASPGVHTLSVTSPPGRGVFFIRLRRADNRTITRLVTLE